MAFGATLRIIAVLVAISLIDSFAFSEDYPEKNLATIDGRVINATTGEPVVRAAVTLSSASHAGSVNETALSDDTGTFAISRVPPGEYNLCAIRPGFMRKCVGGQDRSRNRTISFSAGEHKSQVSLALTAEGIVTGHVIDGNGDPLENISVSLLRRAVTDKDETIRMVGATFTNDLGEYRIAHLAPGSYYVQARAGKFLAGQLEFAVPRSTSQSSSDAPHEGIRTTYYPGSYELKGATSIQVAPGSEVRGIDIQLRRDTSFCVRGRIMDAATGAPAHNVRVLLTPAGASAISGVSMLPGSGLETGDFEFGSVFPGSHSIVAALSRDGVPAYTRQDVDVADKDVVDLVIWIPRPGDIVGRIVLPENHARPSLHGATEGMRVVLHPVVGLTVGSIPSAPVRPDGSFNLNNVSPDTFRVAVVGGPTTWYMDKTYVDGRESLDGTATLSSGTRISIVMAAGAGTVEGLVRNASGNSVAGAVVTLASADADTRTDQLRNATSDKDGHFEFTGVIPGHYRAYAWEDTDNDTPTDPDLLRLCNKNSADLTLSRGGHELVSLQAISGVDIANALGESKAAR